MEAIAKICAIKTISKANSKNVDIPSKIAEGIMKYQNFSSKKDSMSSSSISQKDDEHSTTVIISHLIIHWLRNN
jgi:hypothetical protein